jgi:hypothetical protein
LAENRSLNGSILTPDKKSGIYKEGGMNQTDKKEFRDKILICCDCGNRFIFTAGEAAYYFSKGLSEPKRDKPCRELRKQTLIPDTEKAARR